MSSERLLWPSALRRFRWAREGIAAVEFALLLPILLTLVLATAEVVNAVDQRRKVVQLGRTLADLTAQGDSQSPIAQALMSDILASAGPVLAPFQASAATIQISAIGIYQANGHDAAYVCSTYPTSGKRAVGTAAGILVPTNFQRVGARFVLAEVTMPYKSILGAVVPKVVKGLNLSLTWSEAVSWPVRSGTSFSADPEVVMPGGAACP